MQPNRLTVYIYNLPYKIPIRHLKQYLQEVIERKVKPVKLKMRSTMPGQAFVLMKKPEDAFSAIKYLNDRFIWGKVVKAELCRTEMRTGSLSSTLVVLHAKSESELCKVFGELKGFVRVRYVESRNVGFIDFETHEFASNGFKVGESAGLNVGFSK